MSGKKFYHQRFREKKSYPNHITHIPASKLKWSAPEVDSLRVKTNLIFKGYMTSEGKDAVFKRWRRLTSQDRVLSPVWETIICALPESISGPLQTVHSLKAHKFTAPLPQMNTLKIFFDFPLSLLFPFCRPIARFFVMGGGGGYRKEPCWGVWGILHLKMFKFGGSKTLFSALVMGSVSKKSTLNIKMANNLLQFTIIKITESKENNSILRLYVRGSWLCFIIDQKLN